MSEYHTTAANRFDTFNIYSTSYKKIGGHEIEVNVIVPKNIKPGKHPLIVKFHGGSLVTGTALFPDWFAAFFVPFIHRNCAITIMPNYRLLPEHSGKDILEDLSDFWTWFQTSFPTYLSSKDPTISPDFNHLLVTGESAGGYLVFQSALTTPKNFIKACIAQYPMTNTPCLSKGSIPTIFGPLPPPSLIDDHLSTITPGTTITSAIPPTRIPLSFALFAHGRYEEFFGKGKELWPITAVEGAAFFPPSFIIHGTEDEAVSVEDSKAFVEKVESVVEGAEMRLATRPGNHGFDVQLREEDEGWLKEGLAWVEVAWLA
ncbi:alpha/beta-hydrolase [Lindgomyces ingoldianus]|uniref:Alpha/beta-hydrolase n=1 Tax=Lindgomyces ingoldianus TaxID=673940 RepID=A0ACB6RGF7_9PLEO|nr:alpha/beta-hydrolase [Lindgomyces ingoldianus]KAF2478202.1 alpha/beta-hydrolase [Lindgomyces ingoldianus]